MTAAIITSHRRRILERWIEDAIALLDRMDGDADLEQDTDAEPDPLEPYLAEASNDLEQDDAEEDMPGRIWGGAGL